MRLVAVALAALALAAPAAAATCRPPTLGALEGQVMCPTCKTTLDQSSSPIAERIRAYIRAQIAQGKCEDEIKAQLVDEFGEQILASPPKKGFNLLAWLLPLAALAAAAAAVAVGARRWTRAREPAAAAEVPLDADAERRVDEALASFDG